MFKRRSQKLQPAVSEQARIRLADCAICLVRQTAQVKEAGCAPVVLCTECSWRFLMPWAKAGPKLVLSSPFGRSSSSGFVAIWLRGMMSTRNKEVIKAAIEGLEARK